MTLSLYRDTGHATYSTYFNWMPDIKQWWITGFVPDIYDYSVREEELITIASVDFSQDTKMYEALKGSFKIENKNLRDKVIFDDKSHIIWIIW